MNDWLIIGIAWIGCLLAVLCVPYQKPQELNLETDQDYGVLTVDITDDAWPDTAGNVVIGNTLVDGLDIGLDVTIIDGSGVECTCETTK
jgi:hypothetical protein